LEELLSSGRISNKQTKIAIVANRVIERTHIFKQLEEYLGHLNLPVLTHLRESQNYIRSADRGLGLFELAPSMVWPDLEQWDPIIEWLNSRKSIPTK
jgi:chromosome partitioning protein